MSRSAFPVWLSVMVAAIFVLCTCETSFAQSVKGFPKSSRGFRPPAAKPPAQRAQNLNRGQQGRSYSRAGQQSSTYNKSRYRNQSRYNYPSIYSSRSVLGTGNRFSPSHFQGYYVPLNRYGYSNLGLQGFGFGNGFNQGYSTYGSYLNTGGVFNQNVIGSSVASQALEQLRNQQAVGPIDPEGNAARDAEILRLQIELERAKQALANQQQPPQRRQTLKPPIDDDANQKVVEQLGLAPIIETNQLAASSHLKAERAFRSGEYGQAARFSGLAKSLDESNGKLMLFASQAHFANGEYRDAVKALKKANTILPPEEMGWVVENFKLFYGRNDFVSQIKGLSSHLKQSPNDANAFLLRGYQYGSLGHSAAAQKDLNRAKELGSNSKLVEMMMERFAVEVVEK